MSMAGKGDYLTEKRELARLIFSASNLSDLQSLRRYLAQNPHLWLTLSEPVKTSTENAIYEADQIECLVNGARNFAFRY